MTAPLPMEFIESDFVVLKEGTPILTAQGYPTSVSMDTVNVVSAIVPPH